MDLYRLVQNNNVNKIKILLSDKNYINNILDYNDSNKNTIFHIVCKYGDVDIVKYLLSSDKIFKSTYFKLDFYKNTPLHLACEYNNVDVLELLLSLFIFFNFLIASIKTYLKTSWLVLSFLVQKDNLKIYNENFYPIIFN